MEHVITISTAQILIFFAGFALGAIVSTLVLGIQIPGWIREAMRNERLRRNNSRF